MSKEYKLCTELLEPTPEMLRSWDKKINGDIYLVKRQVLLRCPITNELVPESQCLRCEHNYGQSSDRWVYCLPETKKFKRKKK